MSLRRFRSVEEMPGPPALPPLDPDNLRLLAALMKLARRLSCRKAMPGLRKFRSLEEADAAWNASSVSGSTPNAG